MLAARALGIGSCPTTLHPVVMERFYKMFNIPSDAQFHFCIPLGYPKGNFGPTTRRPTAETTYLNGWGAARPLELSAQVVGGAMNRAPVLRHRCRYSSRSALNCAT